MKCTRLSSKEFNKLASDIKKNGLKWICSGWKSKVSVIVLSDAIESDPDEHISENIYFLSKKT